MQFGNDTPSSIDVDQLQLPSRPANTCAAFLEFDLALQLAREISVNRLHGAPHGGGKGTPGDPPTDSILANLAAKCASTLTGSTPGDDPPLP
jgi:hypothetical protein